MRACVRVRGHVFASACAHACVLVCCMLGREWRRQDGPSPLYKAAQFRHVEAVRILIEAKADINAKSTVRDPA